MSSTEISNLEQCVVFLSFIQVSFIHKNISRLVHTLQHTPVLFFVVFILILTSPQAHASFFGKIGDSIKSFIVKDNEDNSSSTSNTQNMDVFKPDIVREDSKKEAQVNNTNDDTLSVATGALRLSTEEIDFPVNETISVYEVKKGDTIASVATLFNVSKNTIVWANDIKNNTIRQGDTLVILPITGIKYTVKKGDTVASITKKYKGDIDDVARYNGISKDALLAVGESIVIPEGESNVDIPKQNIVKNGKKNNVATLATAAASFFVKPLASFVKTQGIHGHNGVDLATKIGSPIVAVSNGTVLVSKMGGWNGGYGNMIIIGHKNNIQTLYAHLMDVYVAQGAIVEQGQIIGTVGSTGHSTGPHLHIEVRGAVNPF